ncbi:MAG: protein-disulfide reductase DsbD domain-containing protein [Verrucomicrobiota bacterium]
MSRRGPEILCLSAGLLLCGYHGQTAETAPVTKTGLARIELISEVTAIVPGKPFTLGLLIVPEKGFHTYWKGPGIVGVATRKEWTLPEGFSAGEILWPPPVRTDMAGLNAHGYRSETCLLTEILPPSAIEADVVTIKLEAAWMACSTSCHPGTATFEISLPVERIQPTPPPHAENHGYIESTRASIPPAAPESWQTYPPKRISPDLIQLEIGMKGIEVLDLNSLYFFCDDMQVHSDEAQTFEVASNPEPRLRILLKSTEFAPSDPETISGLLYSSLGWANTDSKWIRIEAAWPTTRTDYGKKN